MSDQISSHSSNPYTTALHPASLNRRSRSIWPWNYGLSKQHSVEYWMMALLLYDDDDDGRREAVRVSNPESADVFFVPFFSSLSFLF
ncbi:hypothetical protein LOK49_Contig47G00006 [Camellia lanceoleosa]|nr:hypothetical protein LOK49_Contig47G00006 [Camellia lanceoleosa]